MPLGRGNRLAAARRWVCRASLGRPYRSAPIHPLLEPFCERHRDPNVGFWARYLHVAAALIRCRSRLTSRLGLAHRRVLLDRDGGLVRAGLSVAVVAPVLHVAGAFP